jgi:TonB family protein
MRTCVLMFSVCQDADAAEVKDAAVSSTPFRALRQQIAARWKSTASATTKAAVYFKVNDKNPKSVGVYNSSGSDKFDADARAAVAALVPIKVVGVKDGTQLHARFDPFVHSVDIYKPEDVDFGPYMATMQRTVKRHWFPPRGNESKRVIVFWKVKYDGTISGVKLDKTSGVAAADAAALKAVRTVGKLRPLPSGAPDSVDIQFTFDYNAKGGSDSEESNKSKRKTTSSSARDEPGPAEKFFEIVDQFLKP